MPPTIEAPAEATVAPAPKSEAKPEGNAPGEIYSAAAEIDELDEPKAEPKPEPKKAPAKPVKPDEDEPETEDEPEEGETDTEEDADSEEPSKADTEIDDLDTGEGETKPKETEKPAEKPVKMRDLKVVYEQTKAEKKALEAKYSEATKQIEQLKRANPDEVKALSEKLQKAESRRDELEQEMRHINYQSSDEFKTKYQKPYQDAWARATKDLSELTVDLADGASRKATPEDLATLANLPLGEARRQARDMFGEAADDVMAHRRKILDLSEAQQAALAESRTAAQERAQTRAVEERARGEKLQGIYRETVTQIAEKFPRLFKPVPGDDEGNQFLERGFSEVDRFFSDNTMPVEERVKAHALFRFKAANHDRLQLRMVRMATKLREARAKLEKFEKSEPPGGKTGGHKSKSVTDVYEQAEKEIEALDEA